MNSLTITLRLGTGNSCWVELEAWGASERASKRDKTDTGCFKTNCKKNNIQYIFLSPSLPVFS